MKRNVEKKLVSLNLCQFRNDVEKDCVVAVNGPVLQKR